MERILIELNNIIKEQESILIRRRQENLHRILMQELILRHTLRENFSINTMDFILSQILDKSIKFNASQSYLKEPSLSSNSSFDTVSDDSIYRKHSNNTLTQDYDNSSNVYHNGMEKVLSYIQSVSSSIAASCTRAAIQTTLDSSLGLVLAAYMPQNNSLYASGLSMDDQYNTTSQYCKQSFEDILGLIDHIGQMQSIHAMDKYMVKPLPRKQSDIKKSSSSLLFGRQSSTMEFKSLASALLKLLRSNSDMNLTESIKRQDTDSTMHRYDTDTTDSIHSDTFNTESVYSIYSNDSTAFLFKCIIPQLMQVDGRIDTIEQELLNLYQERHILNTLKSLELNYNNFGSSYNNSSSLLERLDSLNKLKNFASEDYFKKSKNSTTSFEHIIPPWMMQSKDSLRPLNTDHINRKKTTGKTIRDDSMPTQSMNNHAKILNTSSDKSDFKIDNVTHKHTISNNTIVTTDFKCATTNNNSSPPTGNNNTGTIEDKKKIDNDQKDTTQFISEYNDNQSFERQLSEITRLLSILRLDSRESIKSEESSFHLNFLNSNEWAPEELSALSTLANALKVKSEEYVSLHHKKNRRAKKYKKKPKNQKKQPKKKRHGKKSYTVVTGTSGNQSDADNKNGIENYVKPNDIQTPTSTIEPEIIHAQYKMIKDGPVVSDDNIDIDTKRSTDQQELCVVGSKIKPEAYLITPQQMPKVYQQYFISPAGFTIRILRTDSVESVE